VNALIEAAIGRARPVLLVLALVLIAGAVTYVTIPKEADPDIPIPIVYVSVRHEGISPEDAERLLIRPLEKELRSIEGLKEMRATAREGQASITLEFEAGFDVDQALDDVRKQVDLAKAELPAASDEPLVEEVNFALFPVVVVNLHGEVDERVLIRTARELRDKIEALPGVLGVDIAGDREDLLEVLVDPARLEAYNQTPDELVRFITRNNQLVAAGVLDSGAGRFPVKVPGLFEDLGDVLDLPIKTSGDRVVTFRDVAVARRTFKDADGFARVGGQPAVALEVRKRIGTNIIEVVSAVRRLVERERASLPAGIEVGFSQDKSGDIRNMLADLQNNVLAAIVLVMVVVIAALGLRAAGLVGLSIPGSFLAGILVIGLAGMTVNIVVLFALIMAVGMLVDGTIVVVELADRKMAEGLGRRAAYTVAAQRMAWPIIASTATTLAAFMPLLFWPGVVGEFMKYLPITLIATLTASLVMALVFVPTVGSLVGRRAPDGAHQDAALAAAESGDLDAIGGLTGAYVRLARLAARHPGKVVALALALLIGVYGAYGRFGHGVEFFPEVEPRNALVDIRARGDLAIAERDALVREVEQRILDIPDFASVYTRSGTQFHADVPEDTIGLIQLELRDWRERRPARVILEEVRRRVADLPGVVIELRKEEAGPPIGKPIQLQVSARDPALLPAAVEQVRAGMAAIPGIVDATDNRPLPGIEWRLRVDRAEASRFGADIAMVGSAVKLVTNGIRVGGYRPDDTDEEVDIRVRFPRAQRSLDELERLRVPTPRGAVPLGNFVTREAVPRVGTIERVDGRRVLTVQADVAEGALVDDQVRALREWLAAHPLDPRVTLQFKGEDEEQRKAEAFLVKAFGVALFVMAVILVTQFNSFYQAALILSAVVLSTIGVLLGLMVIGEPFGIVMSGIGVIALAGIVVNNNIVLIDTYNRLRRAGLEPGEAVVRTGALRLRPVLLTTVTTVLGLLPMVLGVNVDLLGRTLTVGGPSTQWWTQLATAVAGGLTFATVLTLVLTPSLLILGERFAARRGHAGAAPARLGDPGAA